MNDYLAFLRSKIALAEPAGLALDPAAISPVLKPHQAATVRWAAEGGRRAIFAAFGLGKTLMQLELMRLIRERAGGRALIVAPLGVRQEFIRDAKLLDLPVRFIRRIEAVDAEGWIPDFILTGPRPVYCEIKPTFWFDPEVGEKMWRGAPKDADGRASVELLFLCASLANLRQQYAAIGWMRETGREAGPHPAWLDGWSYATAGRFDGAEAIDFCAFAGSKLPRIHGGDDGWPPATDPDELAALWAEAGNRVQWKAPR